MRDTSHRFVSRMQRLAWSSRSRRRLAVVVGSLVSGTGVFAATGLAGGGDHFEELERVSNRGRPALLLPEDRRVLERLASHGHEVGDTRVMGVLGSRVFYRIERDGETSCYAVGPAADTHFRLGKIVCAELFPSRQMPLLDFTTLAREHGSGLPIVVASEGIVADGIVKITFEDAAGKPIRGVRVEDNLFQLRERLPAHAYAIVAHDRAGNAVASRLLPRAPIRDVVLRDRR